MLMYVNRNYYYYIFFPVISFFPQNVILTNSGVLSGVWMFVFIVQKEQMISPFKQELMVSNRRLIGIFAVGNDMVLKHYTRCIYVILFTLCGYEIT